jgi:hypothetical protein
MFYNMSNNVLRARKTVRFYAANPVIIGRLNEIPPSQPLYLAVWLISRDWLVERDWGLDTRFLVYIIFYTKNRVSRQ